MSDELFERACEAVHAAWAATKRAQGFHAPNECPSGGYQGRDVGYPGASGRRLVCGMCHASLVTFADLPESEKDSDRATVRAAVEPYRAALADAESKRDRARYPLPGDCTCTAAGVETSGCASHPAACVACRCPHGGAPHVCLVILRKRVADAERKRDDAKAGYPAVWIIDVHGYGAFFYIGTEAEAEEVRACKAQWEGAVGGKREVKPHELADAEAKLAASESKRDRAVVCVWCNENTAYAPDVATQEAIAKLYADAKAHDQACVSNPLVAKLATAMAESARLRRLLAMAILMDNEDRYVGIRAFAAEAFHGASWTDIERLANEPAPQASEATCEGKGRAVTRLRSDAGYGVIGCVCTVCGAEFRGWTAAGVIPPHAPKRGGT